MLDEGVVRLRLAVAFLDGELAVAGDGGQQEEQGEEGLCAHRQKVFMVRSLWIAKANIARSFKDANGRRD